MFEDNFVARQIAIGRILFGVVMLLFPRLLLRRSAPDAPGPAVWVGRLFGVRDIALGAGTLSALQADDPGAGRWVAVGAAADAADVATALVWREELGREGVFATLAVAVPAMLGGAKAARGLVGATRP